MLAIDQIEAVLESSLVGTLHFEETKKLTQQKGETLFNLAVVIKEYKEIAVKVEEMMKPRVIPPGAQLWTLVIPHLLVTQVAMFQIGDYPGLMATIKKDCQNARGRLQEHIENIAILIELKDATTIYVNAAQVWEDCRIIALNLDAANDILSRLSEPTYTPQSVAAALRSIPEVAKDVTRNTVKFVIDSAVQAGEGAISGFFGAIPWWVYPAVGIPVVLYFTKELWMPLIQARASRLATR